MGTTAPPEPKGIMWEDSKTLNSRAEEVMKDVGVQETPENQFLAYLSVVSSNSIKTVLILVLLACFGDWGLAAETQHTYWSHILDPQAPYLVEFRASFI